MLVLTRGSDVPIGSFVQKVLLLLSGVVLSLDALVVVDSDLDQKLWEESQQYCKSIGHDANDVVRENCLPGSPSTDWDVNAGGDPYIQGFARPFSTPVGNKVEFRVKTIAKKYKIDIYRLGYYSGDGARLVHTISSEEIQFYGEQPKCHIKDPSTRLVDCLNWNVGGVWDTSKTPNVVSGVYVGRLVRQDVNETQWSATWRGDGSAKKSSPLYGGKTVPDMERNSDHPALSTIQRQARFLPEQLQPGHLQFPFPRCDKSSSIYLDCEAVDHAHGARRRRDEPDLPVLRNELREPYASLVYFVVRKNLKSKKKKKSRRNSEIVFQTSDITWQAYNVWDSPNMYGRTPQGNCPHHNFTQWWVSDTPTDNEQKTNDEPKTLRDRSDGFNVTFTSGTFGIGSEHDRRAVKKSYNTPFITRDLSLYNSLFSSEYPMIRFLEAHGFDVSYISGLDTHLDRNLGNGVKIFLSVGHDEYWSSAQRNNVENMRDNEPDAHLAFFSGNEVFWQVRWEKSTADVEEPDVIVTYKESQIFGTEAMSDGIKSFLSYVHPTETSWTGVFRDPRRPGKSWAENSLTGQMTTVNALRNDPLHVPKRYAAHRFWRNTDLQKKLKKESDTGVMMKGMLGHEWDTDFDNAHRPEGLMRLSETTVDNVHSLVDYASAYDSATETHHLTLYKKKKLSGSGDSLVFGAGTCQFSWALDPFHDRPTGTRGWENEQSVRVLTDLNGGADPNVMQAVLNLFADMSDVQPQTLLKNSYGLTHASPADLEKSKSLWVQAQGAKTELRSIRKLEEKAEANRHVFRISLSTDISGSRSSSDPVLAAVELKIVDSNMNKERRSLQERWRACNMVQTEIFECEYRVPTGKNLGSYQFFYRGVDDLGNIERKSGNVVTGDEIRELLLETVSESPNSKRSEL